MVIRVVEKTFITSTELVFAAKYAALAKMKSPVNTVAAADHLEFNVATPLRNKAPSIRSSWTSVAVCNNSIAEARVIKVSSLALRILPNNKIILGRMRLPPDESNNDSADLRSPL